MRIERVFCLFVAALAAAALTVTPLGNGAYAGEKLPGVKVPETQLQAPVKSEAALPKTVETPKATPPKVERFRRRIPGALEEQIKVLGANDPETKRLQEMLNMGGRGRSAKDRTLEPGGEPGEFDPLNTGRMRRGEGQTSVDESWERFRSRHTGGSSEPGKGSYGMFNEPEAKDPSDFIGSSGQDSGKGDIRSGYPGSAKAHAGMKDPSSKASSSLEDITMQTDDQGRTTRKMSRNDDGSYTETVVEYFDDGAAAVFEHHYETSEAASRGDANPEKSHVYYLPPPSGSGEAGQPNPEDTGGGSDCNWVPGQGCTKRRVTLIERTSQPGPEGQQKEQSGQSTARKQLENVGKVTNPNPVDSGDGGQSVRHNPIGPDPVGPEPTH